MDNKKIEVPETQAPNGFDGPERGPERDGERPVDAEMERAALERELAAERAKAELELQREIEDRRAAAEESLQSEMSQRKQEMEAELREYRRSRLSEIEAGFDEERKEQEKVSAGRRMEARERLDREIGEERTKRLSDVACEAEGRRQSYETELSEQQKRLTEIHQEIADAQQSLQGRMDLLDTREEALNKEKEDLGERERDLNRQVMDLKLRERMVKQKADLLARQQDGLQDLAREFFGAERDGLDAELAAAKESADELRRRLAGQQRELNQFYELRERFHADPTVLMKWNQELEKQVKELREELDRRPLQELQDKYDGVVLERDRLKEKCEALARESGSLAQAGQENESLQRQISLLSAKFQERDSQVKEYEGIFQTYQARLDRLSSPENVVQDRDARIAEITKSIVRVPDQTNRPQPKSEIEWLKQIQDGCEDYGIKFPKRILYAFHTALKIADWSSVVVLAGVSGTGKSELPRLYSLFGGINFLNTPVQPNWDSQESMLGYFNSIDNRFDAQPLLRFLAQCTQKPPRGERNDSMLGEYMSIVLLDEMNLAHVELYFADFLSKLEQRRGLTANDLKFPKIEVKLGAGIEPYEIPLSRNVLWVGTMNQDETTKSLSDKVLDRGIVINFPRPRTLQSRESMGKLKDAENATLLKYSTWNSWCRRYMYEIQKDERGRSLRDAEGKELRGESYFNEEEQKELARYRGFVEELNDELDKAGRAIGHRVWQSIEYYILNYPDVISEQARARDLQSGGAPAEGETQNGVKAAMMTAFEDQIVQKIMPKLRGIETHRDGGKLLDEIEHRLTDMGFTSLLKDFKNARERGYGQFVWNSAEYLDQQGG